MYKSKNNKKIQIINEYSIIPETKYQIKFNYNQNEFLQYILNLQNLLDLSNLNNSLRYNINKPESFNYDNTLLHLFYEILPDYKYYSAYSIMPINNAFINYEIITGLDPIGYCITLTYLYLFMILFNISNYTNSQIYKYDNSKYLSFFMTKWIYYYDDKKYNVTLLRNFANILFQYYNKFIDTLINNFNEIQITLYKSEIVNYSSIINVLVDYVKEKNLTIDKVKLNETINNFLTNIIDKKLTYSKNGNVAYQLSDIISLDDQNFYELDYFMNPENEIINEFIK